MTDFKNNIILQQGGKLSDEEKNKILCKKYHSTPEQVQRFENSYWKLTDDYDIKKYQEDINNCTRSIKYIDWLLHTIGIISEENGISKQSLMLSVMCIYFEKKGIRNLSFEELWSTFLEGETLKNYCKKIGEQICSKIESMEFDDNSFLYKWKSIIECVLEMVVPFEAIPESLTVSPDEIKDAGMNKRDLGKNGICMYPKCPKCGLIGASSKDSEKKIYQGGEKKKIGGCAFIELAEYMSGGTVQKCRVCSEKFESCESSQNFWNGKISYLKNIVFVKHLLIFSKFRITDV